MIMLVAMLYTFLIGPDTYRLADDQTYTTMRACRQDQPRMQALLRRGGFKVTCDKRSFGGTLW